jgi:3-oxoacyl-[acyl-carrier protein] reductase
MMLKDKVTLVTGAAKGIGAAIAEAFAREGASAVVIVDIDEDAAARTAEDIVTRYGCRCVALRANVSDESNVKRVFETVDREFGRLDVLVNNAGVCKLSAIDDITIQDWDRTMNVNLKGAFLFCREALKRMKANGGKIVNMASQAGKTGGLIVGPDYSASKAGVLSLTKTFAKHGASFGVNVNSVAPGLIDTDLTKDFGYDPKSVPLGRIGTPEDVADAVVFLASDRADYITGACIDVNGGMTMW